MVKQNTFKPRHYMDAVPEIEESLRYTRKPAYNPVPTLEALAWARATLDRQNAPAPQPAANPNAAPQPAANPSASLDDLLREYIAGKAQARPSDDKYINAFRKANYVLRTPTGASAAGGLAGVIVGGCLLGPLGALAGGLAGAGTGVYVTGSNKTKARMETMANGAMFWGGKALCALGKAGKYALDKGVEAYVARQNVRSARINAALNALPDENNDITMDEMQSNANADDSEYDLMTRALGDSAEVEIQRNANQIEHAEANALNTLSVHDRDEVEAYGIAEHAEANALNAYSEHDRAEVLAYDTEENNLMPAAYSNKFVKANVDESGIGPGTGMHTLCEKVAFLISKGPHATGDDKQNWYKAQDYLARYFESENVEDASSFVGYANKWANSAGDWFKGQENLANCVAHYNENKK